MFDAIVSWWFMTGGCWVCALLPVCVTLYLATYAGAPLIGGMYGEVAMMVLLVVQAATVSQGDQSREPFKLQSAVTQLDRHTLLKPVLLQMVTLPIYRCCCQGCYHQSYCCCDCLQEWSAE